MNILRLTSYALLLLTLLGAPAFVRTGGAQSNQPDEVRLIVVSTSKSSLTLVAAPRRTPAREDEFYPQAGNGFVLEPAVQAVHADGNTSIDLVYAGHEASDVDANVSLTRISLKDRVYPFFVTLNLKAYRREDVIEQWAEIRHEEEKPVTLARFASSAPVVKADAYWLTQFQGNYMREAALTEDGLSSPLRRALESAVVELNEEPAAAPPR